MSKNSTHLKLLSLLLFMSIGSSSWGGNINPQSTPIPLTASETAETKLPAKHDQPQINASQKMDVFNMLYWINSAADEGEPQAKTFLTQAKKYGWLGLNSLQNHQPERKTL